MKIALSASFWPIRENWELLSECSIIITSQKDDDLLGALAKLPATIYTTDAVIDSPEDAAEILKQYGDLGDEVEYVTFPMLHKNMQLVEKIYDAHMNDDWYDAHPEVTHDAWKLRKPCPSAVLKDGTKVINFSSGHDFHFTDGTILKKCHSTRVMALKVNIEEEDMDKKYHDPSVDSPYKPNFQTVALDLQSMQTLWKELERWIPAANSMKELRPHYDGSYIVIVPLMVLDVFHQEWPEMKHYEVPFRAVRARDRAMDGKPQIIFTDKWCWIDKK